MAVRSITESPRKGANSVVQNHDQRPFFGTTANTPLKSASSWVKLKSGQGGKEETRKIKKFEDGNLPATRPYYDRQAHTHHMVKAYNAPQNNILELLIYKVQLNTTHCHNNLFKHKTSQLTLHLTIHCQWLKRHPRVKTRTQATLSTDLLKESEALHPKNDPKRLQPQPSQQRRAK